MSWRDVVGFQGAVLAFVAGIAVLLGLAGALQPWLDALNHFAPVWLCLAWIGGLVARALLQPGKLRGVAVITAAVAVVGAGGSIVAEALAGARELSPGTPGLTLLTFNRWWDTPEPDREARAIRAANADVVLLQEADHFETQAEALKDLYPYQLLCGGHCDTAILSKRPLLASGKEDHAAWRPGGTDFLWARTTAADGKPVTLATVHTYWPIPPWVARYQRSRILQDLKAVPQDDVILTGDFNLTPWSFALRGFDREIAPLTRRTHGVLSFPATWPAAFLALDQVFAAPAWKTVSVERLPRAGSDHYPVLVKLRR